MTAPEQVASTAQQQAGAVAGTAKEQAASVASTATSAASEVTGTAKEQVGTVVGETVAQAKDLTSQVKEQATQQVKSQTEFAAGALRDLSKQLSEGDTSGMVGTVLTEVGNRVQSFADVLEEKGPAGLLDDVRRFARRSPGSFLLGAALAGLVTGRLVKGLQGPQEQLALPAGSGGGGTASGDPLAGVTSPGVADEAVVPSSGVGTGAYETSTSTFGTPGAGSGTGGGLGTTPPPPYPGTDADSPYSAGYGTTSPYGAR